MNYHFPYGHPYQNPYYYNRSMPMNHFSRNYNCCTNPNDLIQANHFGSPEFNNNRRVLTDYGPNPFVININEATKQNNTYRTALWTGGHLQATLMSLNPGENIGLEMHPNVDQFLRIEQGQGITEMGKARNHLDFKRAVSDDSAIFIPAGTWHNLTNTGTIPLKLYSIYAPPNHPFRTVHPTKAFAMKAENENHHRNAY